MAKITIEAVASKTYYKINFNEYSTQMGVETRIFWPESLEFIDTDGHVTIAFNSKGQDMFFSFDELDDTKILKVDLVLGIAPTSNEDLALKIANLKG